MQNANLKRANLQDVSFRCESWLVPGLNTTLDGANLMGANVTGANSQDADWDSAIYNQWTVFPADFDPAAEGLIYVESPAGDFDMDNALDVGDVDILSERIRLGYVDSNGYWNDAMFELNVTVS